VHPNDINQGALGNCYFLAVLSAIAEHENRIKAHFYTQKVNNAGIYLMSFFVNGVEKPVIVDDWFPVELGRKKQPAFASSKDEELWVMLMEKAWAKLNGTYARSESGMC
jgi:calpain-15